jgi:hypothetical protein
MQELPEIAEFNKRLKPLIHELRADSRPCPFVLDASDTKRIALSHYSAGGDATYIHVSRKWDGTQPPADLAVIIQYAPSVEGTTIIYDLIDETMQGKARPFVCNLGRQFIRAYMLLPFQVEEIVIRTEGAGDRRHFQVAFLDARSETIQAALPFELRLLGDDGKALRSEYHATDRQGRWSREAESFADASKIVVRSLLTGEEQTIRLSL